MIDKASLRADPDVIATEVAAAKADGGLKRQGNLSDRTVRVAGDASDLNAFAKRVLALAADAAVQQSIAAGTYSSGWNMPLRQNRRLTRAAVRPNVSIRAW